MTYEEMIKKAQSYKMRGKPKKGAQVMRKNEKITALYERLSRDDFGKDDDQQRELLGNTAIGTYVLRR